MFRTNKYTTFIPTNLTAGQPEIKIEQFSNVRIMSMKIKLNRILKSEGYTT
jgi:hypothetical protein